MSNYPSGKMDAGLAALVMLARYHQVAADSNQLRHHFGTHERPFQRSEILRADGNYVVLAKVSDEGILIHLPIAYFMSRQVGNTVARVRELDTIRNFITSSALTLVIDLFFTIVFFAVMYLYSPTLTWVVLGSIPFYLVLSVIITSILRRRLDEQFKRGAENQAFLTESMYGIETVKALAVEPQNSPEPMILSWSCPKATTRR